MADRGWVKVYRGGWLWDLPPGQFRVALELVRRANWEDSKALRGGRRIVIERGQVLLSERGIAEACGVSRNTVRRSLNVLQEGGFLTRTVTHHHTVATLVNYDRYQPTPEESHPPVARGVDHGVDQSKKLRSNGTTYRDETSGQADLFGEPPDKPKRKTPRQPAHDFLDAFARGAGKKFLRPEALDRRTAPALNKFWCDLRESEAAYTLDDVEAAGRRVASWREKPVNLSWLQYGTNLVDAITEARNRGRGGHSLPPPLPLERRR
jgi:DNA-binding transcriptional regulator YhcF (GntR family)